MTVAQTAVPVTAGPMVAQAMAVLMAVPVTAVRMVARTAVPVTVGPMAAPTAVATVARTEVPVTAEPTAARRP